VVRIWSKLSGTAFEKAVHSLHTRTQAFVTHSQQKIRKPPKRCFEEASNGLFELSGQQQSGQHSVDDRGE